MLLRKFFLGFFWLFCFLPVNRAFPWERATSRNDTVWKDPGKKLTTRTEIRVIGLTTDRLGNRGIIYRNPEAGKSRKYKKPKIYRPRRAAPEKEIIEKLPTIEVEPLEPRKSVTEFEETPRVTPEPAPEYPTPAPIRDAEETEPYPESKPRPEYTPSTRELEQERMKYPVSEKSYLDKATAEKLAVLADKPYIDKETVEKLAIMAEERGKVDLAVYQNLERALEELTLVRERVIKLEQWNQEISERKQEVEDRNLELQKQILDIESRTVTAVTVQKEGKSTETYLVKEGDSLWTIAGNEGIYSNPYKWLLLYHGNRDQIFDPDLIYPGMVLIIPRFSEKGQ